MNLYDKMQTIEPGRHANLIGRVIYEHSHKLGEETIKKLTEVQTYLDTLALGQLAQEIDKQPWIKSVLGKEAKK